jgi:hypothetical protein
MQKIYEELKLDNGLTPQALNNTSATGKYYSMAGWERCLAILNVKTLAATKTGKLELLEADDAAGTNSQTLTDAEATVTSLTNCDEVTVDLTSVANTDQVIINGLTFEKAAATSAANREFADAAGLETCVEDEDYGVEGITADVSGNVVTLSALPVGDEVLTVSKNEQAGTITLATVGAKAYVEIENFSLSSGKTHIACKVTITDDSGNSTVSVALLRGRHKKAIAQKVGASASV